MRGTFSYNLYFGYHFGYHSEKNENVMQYL